MSNINEYNCQWPLEINSKSSGQSSTLLNWIGSPSRNYKSSSPSQDVTQPRLPGTMKRTSAIFNTSSGLNYLKYFPYYRMEIWLGSGWTLGSMALASILLLFHYRVKGFCEIGILNYGVTTSVLSHSLLRPRNGITSFFIHIWWLHNRDGELHPWPFHSEFTVVFGDCTKSIVILKHSENVRYYEF